MKERYKKRPITDSESVEFLTEQGVPQQFAQVLCARGVNKENFTGFFGNVFHSPFEMKNMQEAVETISFVLEEGGSVLIYGDYDADGLTASSILSLFFSDNGVDNDVIIPTRDDGYGLHADLVLAAFEKKFYDLIITVDCGISNRVEVDRLIEELDAEIIVTDHHELPAELPNCLCVNPKLGYPFPNLAGAGVAWKLVEALAGHDVALQYADLAMIGTIGDLMPLIDENRSIVKAGLQNKNHKSLKKLAELGKCSANWTAADVAMKIAPKINAAGRVGYPRVGLELLLSRDRVNTTVANKLMELNEQRKAMVDSLIAQADGMCNEEQIRNDRLTFLYSDNWPHGILGIAAARYKEKYRFPAVVMTKKSPEEDVYVGSARGVDGVDLFELFSNASPYLAQFGGHKASVGFSVRKENLENLRKKLSSLLCDLDLNCFENELYYDLELDGSFTVAELFDFSQKLQPQLPQDKVVLRVRDFVKFANAFGKDSPLHLSATLDSGLELKGFLKYGVYAPFIKNGADIEAIVTLEKDDYTKNVCGVIEDMHLCNSVCFDSFYRQNLLKNFVPQRVTGCSRSQVEKLLAQSSVLAVFDDYETYLRESESFNLEDFYVDIFFDNSLSQKTAVISPMADYGFSKYKNIVCFCRDGMVRKLPENANYFPVSPANEQLYALSISREICASVYSRLKHKNAFESISGVYEKYLLGKMSYEQYLVALRVFEELKFVEVVDRYTVKILPTEKSDLTNSAIFRCFA